MNAAELNNSPVFTSRATFDKTKVAVGDQLVFSMVNGNGSVLEETVVLTAQDISSGYVDVFFLKPTNGELQTVTVNLTDAAGNTATDTKPTDSARLDTIAPVTPEIVSIQDDVGVTGPVTEGGLTDDNRPTINGTAEPNSTVTIFNNGIAIGTTTADQDGDWTFTPSSPLPDGIHSITAKSTDPAGNQSSVTSPDSFRVSTIDVSLSTASFNSTSVTSGQVIDYIVPTSSTETQYIRVSTRGGGFANTQIAAAFGDGIGQSIMMNTENAKASDAGNKTNIWQGSQENFIEFKTLAVNRVQFDYYDLQETNKTVTLYNAGMGVVATGTLIAGSSVRTFDSGALGQAVKYIGISGGDLDLYTVDRLVISATNITTTVTQTVSDGSSVATTTPTLQGTLSRSLVAGESLRIFANNVDVGAANVSGTSWNFNASLPANSTVNYEAKVMIGGVAVSESDSFTLTQSSSGVTPLVLDLNGDGVQTTSMTSGVAFDIDADGQIDQTAWATGGDGFLVLDRNANGKIDDGSELFGSSNRLSSGELARDGFASLAELDSNSDGVIDANDEKFSSLGVWKDNNSNGVSETGEIRTLSELGIVSLNLNSSPGTEMQHGNTLGLVSSFTTADGQQHQLVDVWLLKESLPVLDLDTVVQDGVADLRNGEAEVLKLSAADVLQSLQGMVGSPGTEEEPQQLIIHGDERDVIKLETVTGSWTQVGTTARDGQVFNVYEHSGDAQLQVLIDQHILQSNIQHS